MRISSALVVARLAAACDVKPAETVNDGRDLVRQGLLDGSNCYAKTPLLCIEDDAYIEGSIDAALASRWNGEMPSKRAEIDHVLRSSKSKYRASMASPAGLATLETLVQARYGDPSIDTDTVPGVVAVDLGALPGRLRAGSPREPAVVLSETDLIDGLVWRMDEAGRLLAKYADAHPAAEEIRLEVRYPTAAARHFVVRYIRAKNVVVRQELEVGRGDSQFVSSPITGGLETLRLGELRLGSADGEHCYPSHQAEEQVDCRIPDRYLEAKRKKTG